MSPVRHPRSRQGRLLARGARGRLQAIAARRHGRRRLQCEPIHFCRRSLRGVMGVGGCQDISLGIRSLLLGCHLLGGGVFGSIALGAPRVAILALAALLFKCADSLADLRLSRPRADPPMRIVRVMSPEPACQSEPPRMDFSRGPDYAGDWRGLCQGNSQSPRPALAGSYLLGWRLTHRRRGDGPAHPAEASRSRGGPHAD